MPFPWVLSGESNAWERASSILFIHTFFLVLEMAVHTEPGVTLRRSRRHLNLAVAVNNDSMHTTTTAAGTRIVVPKKRHRVVEIQQLEDELIMRGGDDGASPNANPSPRAIRALKRRKLVNDLDDDVDVDLVPIPSLVSISPEPTARHKPKPRSNGHKHKKMVYTLRTRVYEETDEGTSSSGSGSGSDSALDISASKTKKRRRRVRGRVVRLSSSTTPVPMMARTTRAHPISAATPALTPKSTPTPTPATDPCRHEPVTPKSTPRGINTKKVKEHVRRRSARLSGSSMDVDVDQTPASPATPPKRLIKHHSPPRISRAPPNPYMYLQAQHLAHVKTRPSVPSPLGMFVWAPGDPQPLQQQEWSGYEEHQYDPESSSLYGAGYMPLVRQQQSAFLPSSSSPTSFTPSTAATSSSSSLEGALDLPGSHSQSQSIFQPTSMDMSMSLDCNLPLQMQVPMQMSMSMQMQMGFPFQMSMTLPIQNQNSFDTPLSAPSTSSSPLPLSTMNMNLNMGISGMGVGMNMAPSTQLDMGMDLSMGMGVGMGMSMDVDQQVQNGGSEWYYQAQSHPQSQNQTDQGPPKDADTDIGMNQDREQVFQRRCVREGVGDDGSSSPTSTSTTPVQIPPPSASSHVVLPPLQQQQQTQLVTAMHALHRSIGKFYQHQEEMRKRAGEMNKRQLDEFERDRRGSGAIESVDGKNKNKVEGKEQTEGQSQRQQTQQPQPQRKPLLPYADLSTYTAHKARSLWIVACKSRMYEMVRRYSAPVVRDFTECVAREYFARRREEEGEAEVEVEHDEEEFRKEEVYEFELMDDEDDEDDEGDDEEFGSAINIGGNMSTFYVPPLQVCVDDCVEDDSSELQNQCQDQPQPLSESSSTLTSNAPQTQTQPETQHSNPLVYIQRPILPLPPPRLCIFRSWALRLLNLDGVESFTTGTDGDNKTNTQGVGEGSRRGGTPVVKSRRDAWVGGAVEETAKAPLMKPVDRCVSSVPATTPPTTTSTPLSSTHPHTHRTVHPKRRSIYTRERIVLDVDAPPVLGRGGVPWMLPLARRPCLRLGWGSGERQRGGEGEGRSEEEVNLNSNLRYSWEGVADALDAVRWLGGDVRC